METIVQSELPKDCEAETAVDDSPEKSNDFGAGHEHISKETASSHSPVEHTNSDSIGPEQPNSIVKTDTFCSDTSVCTEMSYQNQKEALILEPEHEEYNRNENISSSVSDAPSSADGAYDNEAHHYRQDSGLEKVTEHKHCTKPEGYPEPDRYQVILDQYPEPEKKLELQDYLEEQDPEPYQYSGLEQDPQLEVYSKPESGAQNVNLYPGDDYQTLAIETEDDQETHEIMLEPPITNKSILEKHIREEAMSDVSSESCHDLDLEEMDECLRVEIAAASSDSETNEKWRTIFSSSINKEDDDSYLDSLQLCAQELFVHKVEVTDIEYKDNNILEDACVQVSEVEEVLQQPEDIISIPVQKEEVRYNPFGLQGLSKISEDESENGRDATHQKSVTADPNKKLPQDFCVIQETKSKYVSTEHVDFQLARKQWQEMEKQTMSKSVLPTIKQLSYHGSHSYMYTKVQTIDRDKKANEQMQNLNMVGDYPDTQYSPCSEDSGMDESSYKSPYDDQETTVERDIQSLLQKEENLRKERDYSRMGNSTNCATSGNTLRSISTPLTPSFIITSSPTEEPVKQDVSAKNVIILEPSNDFMASPRHGTDRAVAWGDEWQCENNSSNVIILETSNLIIRSASDFSLNKPSVQPQEKMFLNNPFFKLRSRSTISLVDEEIKMMKQREEELRKERKNLYGKDRFNTEPPQANHMDSLAFDNSGKSVKYCKQYATVYTF